uniref:NR LBD domain-containing protein n=1 Tax=Acrobeloides nanus TaxID=290746 RepID=A0A914DLQ3_9BILA
MSMEGTQNSLNDFQMGEVNNSLPIISAESSSTTISYPQSFASIRLLKSFSMKFACMCKCYLTSKHFPDSNDTRCMMTYGYFVDINDIKYFMSENEKKTEIAPLYASVLKQARQLAHKFVQQEISEIDIAALAYMIYSLESEKLLLPMEIVKINKDRLFQELLHYYAIDKGFEHGVVKYSNLLFLIHDIIDLYNHVHEYFTLSKIFDPNFLYVWEDSC